MSSEGSAAGGLPRAYHEFWDWVEDHMIPAIDGHGHRAQYIPYEMLREYWDWDRVSSFPGVDDRVLSIKDIIDRRLIILSILVFVSKGLNQGVQYLTTFCRKDIDDHNLPLRPRRAGESGQGTQYSDGIPDPFSHQDDSAAVWEAFDKWQWNFCPLVFLPRGRVIEKIHEPLDVRQILPVTVLEELPGRSNGATKVFKVRPHPSSGLEEEHIVMKVYVKAELEYDYKKEIQAYTTIRNRSTNLSATEKYFLRYHGSFLQGDKCVILVEYADEKSLLEFFKAGKTPTNFDETYEFWNALSNLFGGLAILHNGKRNVGVHQDLKPANIFVFKKNVENDFFEFKLGDFGTCSVTEVDPTRETFGNDNHATKMYSAPEICRTERDFCDLHKGVTWEADIWSLGCILLETAIWMHHGNYGRLRFLAARQAATRVLTRFCEAGYQGAFHDGHKALDIVRNIPIQLEDGSRRERLSASIMRFVVKEMLLGEEGKRLDAEQLKTRFHKILEDYSKPNSRSVPEPHELKARKSSGSSSHDSIAAETSRKGKQPEKIHTMTPMSLERHRQRQNHDVEPCFGKKHFEHATRLDAQDYTDEEHSPKKYSTSPVTLSEKPCCSSPATSSNNIPASHRNSTAPQDRRALEQHRRSNYPHVTTLDAQRWMLQHKKDKSVKLNGMEVVLTYVANRDQVFIIDNSPSMGPYWSEVESTCEALSYIVKGIGPNGFDVAFTGKPSSIETMKRSSKLFGSSGILQLNKPKLSTGVCRMEHVLSTLLPIIINNSLKGRGWLNRLRKRVPSGINVYVMTNGIWEGEPRSNANEEAAPEANNVDAAIQHAVDLLQNKSKSRIYLSVQFIRFGNHAVGVRRLKWLDDNIKEFTRGWDIVDTTYHEGTSIWKMITGAMSPVEDEAHDVIGQRSHGMEADRL